MIRLVAAIRTTIAVVTLLAVVPLLLLAVGGSPLPHRVPSTVQIQHWMDDPMQPPYVAATIKAGAWLIWALLATAVLAVIGARVRRWRWARLTVHLPGPVQGLAATLLGAATVTTTVVTPPAQAAAPSTAPDTGPSVAATTAAKATAPAATKTADQQGAADPAASTRTVTVGRGDTLWDIAADQLGDPRDWRQIYRLNTSRHSDMHGGDHIEPGWRLVLPARATAPGHHARPGPVITAPTRPDTTTPRPPTAGRPGPSAGTTDGPSAAAACTTPTADRTHAAGSPASRTHPASSQSNRTPASPLSSAVSRPVTAPTQHRSPTAPAGHHTDGVPLLHGWITLPLAASLAAAGAMVWLRRRHRYDPAPAHPAAKDDRSLTPLPPVIAAINRRVRRQAPTVPDLTSAPLSVAEYTRLPRDARPDLPAVGPGGAALSGIGDDDHGTGRGLTGPGAPSAARALLVATLSSGSPADPDAQGLVVLTADTLTALLGSAARPADTPRLHVTADLPDALAHLEALLTERHRHLQDYDVADLTSLRAADPYHPPMPPVLLMAPPPPEKLHARLSNILRLGAPLQIHAMVLGDWPPGETISVQADGHTGTEQLAALDTATTLQLLAVLHEAHTGEPPSSIPVASTDRSETVDDQPGDSTDTGHRRGHSATATLPGTTSDTAVSPTGTPAADHTTSRRPAGVTRQALARRVPIRLIGTPAIHGRDNNPVTGLRHHARELLVYLAVHRDGADLPDIMEAMWPTATLRRAAQRLSTEAADLRRRIRQAAGDTTIQPVVNTGGRYHLDPLLLDIDLWRFHDALRRARTADPDGQAALLRQAIDLHIGTLAQGYDYDWIEPLRERVRRCGIRARLDLAELLADHDPASATPLLLSAAALDPSNEDLARHAMRALAETGDTAGLPMVLQQLQEALHDIDEQPSEETLALVRQLQRPAAEPTAPTTTPGAAATSGR